MINPGTGIRKAGLFFGGLVAGVAAIASYMHMQHLAWQHGGPDKWLAWILPLSVDGLLIVASLAIIVAKRHGARANRLAVVSVVIGLAVSLAANYAAAGDDPTGKLINMWPPIAFALAYELILKLTTTVEAVAVPVVTAPPVTASSAAVPSPAAEEAPQGEPPAPRAAVSESDEAPAPRAVVGGSPKPLDVTKAISKRALAEHRFFQLVEEGRDPEGITPAELDAAIDSKDYSKRFIAGWREQAITAAREERVS